MTSGLALHVLEIARAAGVRTMCVCPGARNAEWVQLLAENELGFEVFWFYEERSAAFFALGRIRGRGSPAAVVTTSGTAVGELLPATMEAYYSGQPLYLLTADRPRRFRGSGAPQASEQVGILGIYAPTSYDLEGPERVECPIEDGGRPVHINACFEDPNGTAPSPRLTQSSSNQDLDVISSFKSPLVIVGALEPKDRDPVTEFLHKLNAPAYFESLSGLRGSPSLKHLTIKVGDQLFARSERCGYTPDVLIRIGGVPTHRIWRDLEDSWSHLSVVSLSSLGFSGLGRKSTVMQGVLSESLPRISTPTVESSSTAQLKKQDGELHKRLLEALANEPRSEPGWFAAMSRCIPRDAAVYLGNSLPIREWDLVGDDESPRFQYIASRGLNGIDGQLSTFLGLCRGNAPNWAILGDLTTLYDLAGPWPLSQLSPNLDANLVIVNNSGGKIFDRMFRTPKFQNNHELTFEHWAAMWGLVYEKVTEIEQFESLVVKPKIGLRVIEVIPDSASTARFWASYHEATK